jgi:GTP-binding protein
VFFDEARIHVKAGRGGNGTVAFRREWGVPRGGPNGGNGAKGGDVYVQAVGRLSTLIAFQNRNYFAAEDGQHGRGKNLHGRGGESLVIQVPLGTVVRDADSGQVLADLVGEGQQVLVAKGGRGGRGNAAFATSTNQAPRISERGEPGEERWLELELKIIADVGLIGMPNAGKSTLLSVISAAQPFVVADLPGLIEGASRGVGLGHQFLRHVERTRLLVHLLDGLAGDPLHNYDVINDELAAFSERLAVKPQIVVLTKIDVPEVREICPLVKEMFAERGIAVWCISASTGEGVQELLWEISDRLAEIPEEIPVEEVDIEPEVDEKAFTIGRRGDIWYVYGKAIERAAKMTNWDQYESAARFQRILRAMGVTMALREAGVTEGDTVFIGGTELQWGWE